MNDSNYINELQKLFYTQAGPDCQFACETIPSIDPWVQLVSPKFDDVDDTFVDGSNTDAVLIKQYDHNNEQHVIVLGRTTAVELLGLLNVWVQGSLANDG